MSFGSNTTENVQEAVRELFRNSGGQRYGLSLADFEAILFQIAGKYAPGEDTQHLLQLWYGLKLEELALARACAAGHEIAWTEFLRRYREKLYDIARAITKEDSRARDLADSLYADLYGIGERDGKRI